MDRDSQHCTGGNDKNNPSPLQKKKWKKAKWLSEEALQLAEKRKDMKGKGERKR